MKYIASILVLLLTTFHSMSQDTIVKRNNEKTAAKIIEVSSTEVKFKRFDYPEGPVFVFKNWEIKYIIYANGVKESFENYQIPPLTENDNSYKKNSFIQPSGKYYYYQGVKIREADMLDIVRKVNDKKLNLMVAETHEKRFLRKGFLYSAIVLGSVGLLTSAGIITIFNSSANTVGSGYGYRGRRYGPNPQQVQTGRYFFLAGIACEVVSITFKIQAKRHAHITVDAYNKYISN